MSVVIICGTKRALHSILEFHLLERYILDICTAPGETKNFTNRNNIPQQPASLFHHNIYYELYNELECQKKCVVGGCTVYFKVSYQNRSFSRVLAHGAL